MLNFRKWLLTEGGNLVIGDVAAQKIDLTKLDRNSVVADVSKGLEALSQRFQAIHGLPLWSKSLLKSKEFLSGSTLHLFDLRNISDSDFIKSKPTVGDIDTQVDENMKSIIDEFLSGLAINTNIGGITFMGFKRTDQFITLWKLENHGIVIQIDLEPVTFKDGKPTHWSRFSHSSSWEDIKEGIKGVFQKYLMRAFQAKSARNVIIQPKTARGKEKIINKSELAFSLKGLRQRMAPVLDARGNQVFKNDMPVYTELDSATADYITDFDVLFSSFFGKPGNKQDLAKMDSFAGLVALMKKYMSPQDQKVVVNEFAQILWGKGAQGLVRGEPVADYDTKIVAFNYLTKELGQNAQSFQPLIDEYYKSYK